jgi:hypothetical protein
MRKTIASLLALGALAGAVAPAASAATPPDPRALACAVQEKLGVENVQDCNF